MSDMKCPFCGQELESHNYTSGRFRHTVICVNKDCKLDGVVLPKIIWQELIHTRKALDVAVDVLKLMYQGNGDPQDIMRYKDNRWTSVRRLCKQALEQITALEQRTTNG